MRLNVHTSDDVAVIENWRACHNHILNAWQAALRNRCKKFDGVVFAQRLKRKKTIFEKLKREPTMALAKMHDIAGCRLIFKDITSLNDYRRNLHRARFKHERIKCDQDPYNYILNPAKSGYRGIHDVYKYNSKNLSGEAWNGLQVEIQYRTYAQHAWATAVEIAGLLTGKHTKFKQGEASDKRFFMLASEIIARTVEGSKSCCSELSDAEIVSQFNKIEKEIRLLQRLKNVRMVTLAISKIETLKNQNLILITKEGESGVAIHPSKSRREATQKYFELEKTSKNTDDIVLVYANSIENIREAFRNYFSDTKDFVNLIEKGLIKLSKK